VKRNARRGRRALALVKRLLDFAFDFYTVNEEKARDAVKLAMKISQKKRLHLPPEVRRRFCRKCATPFVGSSTFSVRVRQNRSPHITIRCKICGFTRRFYFER